MAVSHLAGAKLVITSRKIRIRTCNMATGSMSDMISSLKAGGRDLLI